MKKLLSNDQRGVGHLGLILAVVVVLALGGVGYFVYTKNKGGYGTETSKAIQEALKNAKCDYDDKDLCKFFTSYNTQKYYSLDAVSKSDGQTSNMSVRTEGEDKTHVKLTGEMDYEIITIGNATYTKASDGTWWKQTTANETAEELYNETEVDLDEPEATESADKTSYKKMGKEKCGDLNCFKYEVVDPADPDNTSFLWFDDKDYQLRRMQTTSKDGKTSYDATFTYDKVSIKEPSPVKELGADQYLMPGASEPTTMPSADGGLSPEQLQQLMQQYEQ